MKKIYAEGEWISVKDKLPEIGSEVIVLKNDGNVTALARYIRYEGAKEYFWDNFYGGSNLCLQESITHWMPLPNPPKEGVER